MRFPAAVLVACALVLVGAAQAKKIYQPKIPNGVRVPNPCDTSTIWQGVGHWNKDGGGARNPFGLAFAANSHVWNKALCEMDSDGDGKTNGQELGDPNCVWVEGATPERADQLSHPGICEPVNSLACKVLNGNNIPCGACSTRSTLGIVLGLLLTAVLLR